MRHRVHIRWTPQAPFPHWWVHCPCCSLSAWDRTWPNALARAQQHIAVWHDRRVVSHHPPSEF